MQRGLATGRDRTLIRGYELPAVLAQAMREGSWKVSSASEELGSLFPRHDIARNLLLYDIELCKRETEHLVRKPMPKVFAAVRGSQNSGELDPLRAVLIGDLGVDEPIALDYRTDPPRLVYSVYQNSPSWSEVQGDLTSFVAFVRREGAEDRRKQDLLAKLPPSVRIAAHYSRVRHPPEGFACRPRLAGQVGGRVKLLSLQEILERCGGDLIQIGATADGRSIAIDSRDGGPTIVVEEEDSWRQLAADPVSFYRAIRLGWWRNVGLPSGRHADNPIGRLWHAVIRWLRWGV